MTKYYSIENNIIQDFLDLPDTPTTYAGSTNKFPRSTGAGLEWVDVVTEAEFTVYSGTLQSQIDTLDSGKVDTSGTPVANDIARFTDGDTIEGLSYAEFKQALDLESQFGGLSKADLADVQHLIEELSEGG